MILIEKSKIGGEREDELFLPETIISSATPNFIPSKNEKTTPNFLVTFSLRAPSYIPISID
jgi:hypothetical protein